MKAPNLTLSKLKIVVAEDDHVVRLFLKKTLEEDLGHEVVGEVRSGTDMIRSVLTENPDLVLFDIHLLHMDGLDALHEIYKERIIAAVAVTADRDVDLVQRALEEHVLAYLIKPVDAPQLESAVQVAWARFNEFHSLAEENNSLRQNLQNRKIIERAKGVLMKRLRWTEDEAFRRLQRAAMNQRAAMVDLAQGVLEGKIFDL